MKIFEIYVDSIFKNGKYSEVILNPSKKEFMDFLKKCPFGISRAVIKPNGNLFVWSPEIIHDLSGFVDGWDDDYRLELEIDKINLRHSGYRTKSIDDNLLNNSNLKRLYGKNYVVFDEDKRSIITKIDNSDKNGTN